MAAASRLVGFVALRGADEREGGLLEGDELALGLHESGRELETGQTGQLGGLLVVQRLLRVGGLEGRAEHGRDGLLDLVGRVLAEGEGARHAAVDDARVALHRVQLLGAARFVQVDLQLFGLNRAQNVFLFVVQSTRGKRVVEWAMEWHGRRDNAVLGLAYIDLLGKDGN